MNKSTVIRRTPSSSPPLFSLPPLHHLHPLLLPGSFTSPYPRLPQSPLRMLWHKQIEEYPWSNACVTGGPKRLFSSGQPVAGNAISGQLACPACFLQLFIVFPAGDTSELLCPPEHSVRQADPCARPWPSHQPPLHYGVSAYWQYYSQLRFTATLTVVSTYLPLYLSIYLSILQSLPRPLTYLTLCFCLWWCLLSVDLRPFFFFWFLNYEKRSKELLISTWDTPTSLDPQRNSFCCFWGMCVTCTWARGSAHTHSLHVLARVSDFLCTFLLFFYLRPQSRTHKKHTRMALVGFPPFRFTCTASLSLCLRFMQPGNKEWWFCAFSCCH